VVIADGIAWLDDASWHFDPGAVGLDVRCLVVVLGEHEGATHVVFAPRGAALRLAGSGAASLVADALRVAPAVGLGHPVRADPDRLLHALATRDDEDLIVAVDETVTCSTDLLGHCVLIELKSLAPHATVSQSAVTLPDGRVLSRSLLAMTVRDLLDGAHDRQYVQVAASLDDQRAHLLRPLEDHGAVVRLLTAVPRVDGLVEPLDSSRERRAVELVAYLALRAGEPVTGERLRVRVLGTTSSDAAAKTLFNVASSLRRALGDGPFGARLPPAGRLSRYAVAPDVVCDAAVLEAWVDRARASEEPDEQMAWLRAALELIEGEPFATVLEGYDWFLTEGHLTRLQAVCEDAACELVALALDEGLVDLARLAVDRALLVDPYSERLAAAAARIAAARQASFAAIDPAVRSTAPSAPVVT
jgi:DNA-binding SARP family transcriptional activator